MPDWTIQRNALAESKARLISDVSDPLTKTRTIVRQWDKLADAKTVKLCIDYLDLFTSVSNNEVRSFSVTNPTAAGLRGLESYADIWRCVSNDRSNEEQNPQGQGVRQTLRYGFALDLNFAEGRVMSVPGYPGDNAANAEELYYTIQIPNLNIQAMQGMQDQVLAAQSYTDLIVGSGPRAVTLTGTFYVIHCTPDIVGDGSGALNIVLAQPQCTLDGYTHYGRSRGMNETFRWGVPKLLAQGIMDAWKTSNGIGCSAHATYHQGLCDLILSVPNAMEVTAEYMSEFCAGLTELESIWWDSPSDTSYKIEDHPMYGKVCWTITRSVTKTLTSPNWDIRLIARHTTPVTLQEIAIRQDYATLNTASHAIGIDPVNLETLFPVAQTTGQIQTRSVSVLKDGSLDVTKERQLPRFMQWVLSYPTRWGIALHKHVENATDSQLATDGVVTGLDGSTHNSVTGVRTPANLNTYTVNRIPYSDNAGGEWVNFQRTATWNERQHGTINGVPKFRLWRVTMDVLQTTGCVAAYDFINFLNNGVMTQPLDHTGSHVEILNGGRYFRAIRYSRALEVQNDPNWAGHTYGNWHPDDN